MQVNNAPLLSIVCPDHRPPAEDCLFIDRIEQMKTDNCDPAVYGESKVGRFNFQVGWAGRALFARGFEQGRESIPYFPDPVGAPGPFGEWEKHRRICRKSRKEWLQRQVSECRQEFIQGLPQALLRPAQESPGA